MKVLQVHNVTRFRGGGDRVFEQTVDGLENHSDVQVECFTRDSLKLAGGFSGRWNAARNGMRPPADLLSEFEAHLERFQPDIVHVHELNPYVTPWTLPVCSRLRVPVLMSCHEFRLTCPVGTHLRNGEPCRLCLDQQSGFPCARHNCRDNLPESIAFAVRHRTALKHRLFRDHVDGYLVASAFMKQHFEAAGFGPIFHRPFPIVVEAASNGLPDTDGDYAAYAGRFVPEKGIHTLLEATRLTSIPLKLAGRVGDLPLDLPPSAECLGELRGADLADFYRNARFLVVPSEWDEPYGLVAGEAQLHGRPVIATRVGGLQELVNDPDCGRLVPPRDADALARAMQELWSDPQQCRRMGATGRDLMSSTCSLEAHTKQLTDLYGDLLGAKTP